MKNDITKLSIIYPKDFVPGHKVLFDIYHETKNSKKLLKYTGIIAKRSYIDNYYIFIINCSNNIIFDELEIDRNYFMKHFFKMPQFEGMWPEVHSLDQLHLMLKLLESLSEY